MQHDGGLPWGTLVAWSVDGRPETARGRARRLKHRPYGLDARPQANPRMGRRVRTVLEPKLRPTQQYVQELQREEETIGVAHSSPTDRDREIVVARTIEGRRRLVFQEFTDGTYLAEWWGPNFRDARPRSGGFAELDRMARAREEE